MLRDKKVLRIALAGNPNSGKSTLFNALTGLNQKTGNFPGVTVDKKTGCAKIFNRHTKQKQECEFIDLPGTYSLYPKSLDEKVSYEILTDTSNKDYPDITLIVADAANLKRNLLLASQIIDLKRPCILALNMCDVAEDLGYEINAEELEKQLHIPVVKLNSRAKKGIDLLREKLFDARSSELLEKKSQTVLNEEILEEIKNTFPSSSLFGSLLRMNSAVTDNNPVDQNKIESLENKINDKDFFKKFETQDNLARFKLINSIWEKCVTKRSDTGKKTVTEKLDAVLTHRIWGMLIFVFVLFIIFQSIFFLAEFPMQWIEMGFSLLVSGVKNTFPSGVLNNVIADGILPGLSGIFVFVPQIALLFGFLAILEDTGYMARVSFIMDKLMRGFGLNGRSVIPLISGVACAVPAIMGARTIGNVKERLITILVTPLMSCSARLPVYTLLISLMVPEKEHAGFFNEKGMWLMGLYLLGFIAAILVALALKFILKAKERSYFIMELPLYHSPQWKTIGITMFSKVKVFLWEAGKVIMVISIVLWFLSTHGPGNDLAGIDKKYNSYADSIRGKFQNTDMNYNPLAKIKAEQSAEKLQASYAGHIGKFIEPVIKPLGFDWKIGISLITSFAAREVFVGTMATIYSAGSDDVTSVRKRMAVEINPQTGKPFYTRAVCISLLIFYAFAMQCMSTLAVVRRETHSWKWPVVQFLFMSVMAWLGSFIVYRLFS